MALAGWVLAGLMVFAIVMNDSASTASGNEAPGHAHASDDAWASKLGLEPGASGPQPGAPSSGWNDQPASEYSHEHLREREYDKPTPRAEVPDTQRPAPGVVPGEGGEPVEEDYADPRRDLIIPERPPGTVTVLPSGCTVTWTEEAIRFNDCPSGEVGDALGVNPNKLAMLPQRLVGDVAELPECLAGAPCDLKIEVPEELEEAPEGLVPEELGDELLVDPELDQPEVSVGSVP